MIFEGLASRPLRLPEMGQLTIGRGEACQVRLTDSSASRVHAQLDVDPHGVRVSDLGSANGTLVNGERVAGSRALVSGDVVTICDVSMVLHSPPHHFAADPLRDPTSFRRRLDGELERALRYQRPLAVLALCFERSPDPAQLPQALGASLRRMDSASWLSPSELVMALPESDEAGGSELARRLQATLQAWPSRGGLALCARDGLDTETLISAAREAAPQVDPGQTGQASEAFTRLVVGEQMVLVADATMGHVYELIERLAGGTQPVLVCGEPGTGKALAASALHHWSQRVLEPFVTVKCGSLPEEMMAAELFGYERGTFTGAAASGGGLLESVAGGTVLLDEVAELSKALQVRLLESLSTGQVKRVGDTRERPLAVRLVLASSRDLQAEVAAGRFDGGLLAKLSTAMVWFAPLRDRRREVPVLARAFLDEEAQRAGKTLRFTSAALQKLQEYRWPGNARELKSLVASVVAEAKGEQVDAAQLQFLRATAAPSTP